MARRLADSPGSGQALADDLSGLVVNAVSGQGIGYLLADAARVWSSIHCPAPGLNAGDSVIHHRSRTVIPRGKLVGAALGLFTRIAVAFLQLADQLIALPGDILQVIVGELAPLFPDSAFELVPVASYGIPVHGQKPPSVVLLACRAKRRSTVGLRFQRLRPAMRRNTAANLFPLRINPEHRRGSARLLVAL